MMMVMLTWFQDVLGFALSRSFLKLTFIDHILIFDVESEKREQPCSSTYTKETDDI